MKKYSGSCLCKDVAFEITGEFNGFFLCHCSRCRKETGSAHAANLFSKTAKFEWNRGQEKVKTFRLPESRFSRSFCQNCGSAVPTVDKERMMVPAGSLESDIDILPTAHIFLGSKANWDKSLETVKGFECLPE